MELKTYKDKLTAFFGNKKKSSFNNFKSIEAGDLTSANFIESVRSFPDYLFQVDKNFQIIWVNDNMKKDFPDIIGKFCPELCESSEILQMGCYCRKAIETGEIQKVNIHLNESKGIYGNKFWEGIGVPLKNENSQIIGTLNYLRDVTPFVDSRKLDFITDKGWVRSNELVENIIQASDDKFFKNVVENINIGIAITDIFGRVKYWNNILEEITGLTADEILSRTLDNEIVDAEKTQLYYGLIKAIKGETSYLNESKTVFRKNNKVTWLTGSISPQSTPDNRIVGSIIIIRSFRDYEIPNEIYQDSDETLSRLLVSSPAAIMILDRSYNVSTWNPAAEKLFGWSEEEVLGKPNPIIQKDDSVEFATLINRILLGNVITNYETERRKKDGSTVNVSLSASPLRDNKGEINGIIGILTDISEKRISDEALRESEIRYKSFVQNFQGIAYRLLKNKELVFINGAVESITGYSEDEILKGKISWRELVHPEDLYILTGNDDKIGIVPGFDLDIEYRIVKKDKSTLWIHEHLQNISDKTGRVIYVQGTFQDITLRKQAEEELKHSREQFRNLALHLEATREEEKKHIAFEIHDELGHALTALKLELSWIIKKKHLRQEVMFERVKKMSELIDSTIRKVRSISSELRPSVLDHFGLVAAIEWQTAEFQKRSAVRCRLNIPDYEIQLDENRSIAVFRILQEILTNVARHAQATRVDVMVEKHDNILVLKVSDNGKGIKQDQMANTKSFGLISMRERTKALGGKITISGVIGIGTTVTLQLPITN